MFIRVISFAMGIVSFILSGRSFMFYDNSHVCVGLPLSSLASEVFTTQQFRQNISTILPFNTNPFAMNLTDYDVTRTYQSQLFYWRNGLESGLYFSLVVFLGLNCICFFPDIAILSFERTTHTYFKGNLHYSHRLLLLVSDGVFRHSRTVSGYSIITISLCLVFCCCFTWSLKKKRRTENPVFSLVFGRS